MTTHTQFQMDFFVPGAAAPQGSKKHVGNGIMIESSKALTPWREHIAITAHNIRVQHADLPLPLDGPLRVTLKFVLPRPKTGPRSKQPTPQHTTKPDLDKLVRAVLDALTHVLYLDDSQVVSFGDNTSKRTAEPHEKSGVHITIATLPS